MDMAVNEEYAIIGHAFRNTDDFETLIAEFTPAHFTDPKVRDMFLFINDIIAKGRKPFFHELADAGFHHEALEADLLSRASLDHEKDFSAVRAVYHKNQYRRMADNLVNLVSGEFDTREAEDLISRFMPYSKEETNREYMIDAHEAGEMALRELDERLTSEEEFNGISLSYTLNNGSKAGFYSLDEVLYGLVGGDLVMIGAESGHGKTALAMNLSRIISFHNKKRLYYLNTEMKVEQMVRRWAAMATLINYKWLELPKLMLPQQVTKYREWVRVFQQTDAIVSRIPSLSPKLAKALIKRAQGKHGQIDCVIVDYVGRMELDSVKGMQEYQIMSEITKKLKEIAIELNVPIIALAQLNSEGKLEGSKKMRNECDGLFFLRPKKIETTDEIGQKITVLSDTEYFLIKEKVRRGSTDGDINLLFHKDCQLIKEA